MLEHLFVYGTLAPGRPNAHVLSHLAGSWQEASIRGHLVQAGWGSAQGFPGVIVDASGPVVEGFVLSSHELQDDWKRLDAFEGREYERVTTQALLPDGRTIQVHVYQLRRSRALPACGHERHSQDGLAVQVEREASRSSIMVRAAEVPPHSLLARYVAAGAYADCYVTDLPVAVTHAQFVEAFYTTPLFKVERLLIGLVLSRAATDAQARQLAEGRIDSFAAWSVEARAEDQLILAAGRTRSWLMVRAGPGTLPGSTRLLFGSAVVPRRSSPGGRASMGPMFTALLGFHRLYSRALLRAAAARLSSQLIGRTPASRGEA